jgi:hypothetical protein
MYTGVVSYVRILVAGLHGRLRVHCDHHSLALPTKTLERHELGSIHIRYCPISLSLTVFLLSASSATPPLLAPPTRRCGDAEGI